MEVEMELVKKTTILFPPALHAHLARVARRERVSLGELVRRACETQYGAVPGEDRLEAAAAIRRLSLPVASPSRMKAQAVPGPKRLPR
jgi:hypothetical protein